MRGNDKKRLLVLVLAFVGVLIGEGGLAYYCFAERADYSVKLSTLEQAENAALLKIEQIPQLNERKERLERIIIQYLEILPREEEIRFEDFLEDIDRFRKNTNVEILEAKPVTIKTLRSAAYRINDMTSSACGR